MRQDLLLRPGYNGFVSNFRDRRGLAEFHSHPELEFNLITGGSAWYIVGTKRFLLVPGTIIWLFPDQEHLLVDIERGFRMWIAVLAPGRCPELARDPYFAPLKSTNPGEVHVRRLRQTDAETLSSLCRSLSRTGGPGGSDAPDEHPPSGPARFNRGVDYLFLEAWTAYESGAELESGTDLSPLVAATLRRIAAADGSASLHDTASDLGVSESWLSRAFHREAGIRFTDYCNRLRLTRFQELREARPGSTISALALEAGFGSYAQFYRVYREAYGAGPGR